MKMLTWKFCNWWIIEFYQKSRWLNAYLLNFYKGLFSGVNIIKNAKRYWTGDYNSFHERQNTPLQGIDDWNNCQYSKKNWLVVVPMEWFEALRAMAANWPTICFASHLMQSKCLRQLISRQMWCKLFYSIVSHFGKGFCRCGALFADTRMTS